VSRVTRVIRVLLVDDQPLVRAGLQRILHRRFGFEIVGECDDGQMALAALPDAKPDVVVMDIRMRGMGGVEATRRIRELPDAPPVLVLTTFDDDEVLSGALRAGAAGFALKDAAGEDLIKAVTAVANGEGWLDPAVTSRVLASFRHGASPDRSTHDQVADLTARELDVLRLIGRGATNIEIAAELIVSEGTVKTHIGHIFTKLGLRDRAAAVIYAFDHGLVGPRS
jgi:DNA-binding NarL/FixJ family response regulator